MATHHELAAEAVKASPPLTVVGLTIYGVSLQDWVLLITLAYTLLQIFFLIRDKVFRPYKEKQDGSK